jgi:predicted acylesterase/phospholipase RssA
MTENSTRKRVAIACQGGGAHAAFAAGVLKEILNEVSEERDYEIVALSGTSGGAICAYLAWYGLLGDNKQEASRRLSSCWMISGPKTTLPGCQGQGRCGRRLLSNLRPFGGRAMLALSLGRRGSLMNL